MKWFQSFFAVCLTIVFITDTFAVELTEKAAILLSIQKKNSIKIISLNRALDSLKLEQAYNERLPQITASVEPTITSVKPDSSITNTLDTSTMSTIYDTVDLSPQSTVNSKIQIQQKLPGGGIITGSAEGKVFAAGDMKDITHSSTYSLEYTQPLIKDAWQWGSLNHEYKIATIRDEELSFESKKSLLQNLTEIRQLYWDLYGKKSLMTIYINELSRAEDLLEIEKVRLKLGQGTILDSLNVALSVLSAQQSVMDANIDYETALNTIASRIGISPDTLWIEDSSEVTIPDLPDDTTLLLDIEQFDPSLKVFQKITQRLCLEHQRILQNTYPDLLFKAGVNHSRSGDRFLSESSESLSNAVIGLLLSYSLPVKDRLIEQAQSRYEFQKNEINEKQYRNELLAQLKNLKLSWKKELNRLNLSEQIANLAKRQYDVAQKQYELGTATRLELTDAKNKIVKSESDLLNSRLQMKQLEILLDELTGTFFQKFNLHLK